jgi:hypothetical protein
MTGRIYTSD